MSMRSEDSIPTATRDGGLARAAAVAIVIATCLAALAGPLLAI